MGQVPKQDEPIGCQKVPRVPSVRCEELQHVPTLWPGLWWRTYCIIESHSDAVFLVSGIAQPFLITNNNNNDKAHCYSMQNIYTRKLGFQELIREVARIGGIAGVGTRLPASGLTLLGTRVYCVEPCLPGGP